MNSTLEQIANAAVAEKRTVAENYESLVASAAADRDTSGVDPAAILKSADRTIEQFKEDVFRAREATEAQQHLTEAEAFLVEARPKHQAAGESLKKELDDFEASFKPRRDANDVLSNKIYQAKVDCQTWHSTINRIAADRERRRRKIVGEEPLPYGAAAGDKPIGAVHDARIQSG